jgi:hypothetical protein
LVSIVKTGGSLVDAEPDPAPEDPEPDEPEPEDPDPEEPVALVLADAGAKIA